MQRRPSEVFRAFLFMGATSFGGPAAGLGSLEAEFARRRQWIGEEKARELLTWAKLLPGPVVTQFAILMGREMGGRWGGVAAGLGFLIPAVILVALLSVVGQAGANSPAFQLAFEGGILGALAVVAVSVVDLSRGQLSSRWRWLAFVAAALAAGWIPRVEPVLIFGAGAWRAFRVQENESVQEATQAATRPRIPWFLLLFTVGFTGSLFIPSHWIANQVAQIFQVCLRAAALTFGTGMAVLPVLRGEFIEHFRWLTPAQFSLGLALGQVTPGPMVITAAALGYLVGGWPGFAAGAVGIFLPSFLNSLVFIPAIQARIHSPSRMAAFVSGAFPWVLGALAAAGVLLGAEILHGTPAAPVLSWAFGLRALVLSVLSLLMLKLRPPSWAVIVGMAALSTLRLWL